MTSGASLPADFVVAVARLQADTALWDNLSVNGMGNVHKYFSSNAAAATLQRVLN